jgi:type II secretory pathway component PulF
MATMLEAGVPISRVLHVLKRQARGRMGAALERVEERIQRGENLVESMRQESGFPDLMVDMLEVGETSGFLARTLGEAGRYYEFLLSLWRRFLSRIAWPAAQYVVAVAVVALAFTLLAGLGQDMGSPTVVLVLGYGVPLLAASAYFLVVRPLGHTRVVHEALLRIPMAGRVSRSLALARFSLLMHLMSEAGVSLIEALPRAMRGTGNGAFAARSGQAADVVKQGGTLTEALGEAGVFPEDYLAMVAVAEESGKLAERFDWLARQYSERADASLSAATHIVSATIWIMVVVVIVVFIFMFAGNYVSGLKQAMP